MALGFNFGKSKSSSQSQSTATSNQNVWGPQSSFLQDLYGQGSSLLAGQGGVGGTAQGLVDQILPGTFSGYQSLQNIAGGGGPLSQFINPINPFTTAQIGSLGSELGNFFNTQIMPGLNSSAVQAGGLGGARHNIAAGQAAGDIGRSFISGVTDLLGGAYGQAANAANAQTQAMLGAGSALPDVGAGIFNLGMSPYSAAWSPLQSFSGLLGGPTVLGQSQSQSTGSSTANSFNIGIGGGGK